MITTLMPNEKPNKQIEALKNQIWVEVAPNFSAQPRAVFGFLVASAPALQKRDKRRVGVRLRCEDVLANIGAQSAAMHRESLRKAKNLQAKTWGHNDNVWPWFPINPCSFLRLTLCGNFLSSLTSIHRCLRVAVFGLLL